MRLSRPLALALAVAMLPLAPAHVAAQDPMRCIDHLDDAEVRARLAYVEHALARARRVEIPWWAGWMAFNVVNAWVAWARYPHAEPRAVRDTWLVNGIGASLFLLSQSVVPMPGLYSGPRLRHMPTDTLEQRRAKLRRATHLLERSHFVATTNSNWAAHAGGWAFAVGSTAYVGIRSRDEHSAARTRALTLQFTTTAAFAEATILSVPRRGARAYEAYRAFACSDPHLDLDEPEPLPGDLAPEDAIDAPTSTRAPTTRRPTARVGVGLGSLTVTGTF